MFIPLWALILVSVIALGAIVTFIVMINNLPEDDYGALSGIAWGLSLMVVLVASLFWYAWVWFWLWGKVREVFHASGLV